MVVRPPGLLFTLQILPTYALGIATAGARACFFDAILQALAGHCRVQAYPTVP
jgi:hypothetical protein